MKLIIFAGMAILAGPLCSVHAISLEVRRVSDNGIASSVDFGSVVNTSMYAQGNHYLVIRYAPEEEDANTLKIYSDNPDWNGGNTDRAGLVETLSHSERVPMYWTAFAALQQGINFNSQNETTWKSLKDRNDPGFASASPSDVSVPLFSNETYVYFGAKANSTTSAAAYAAKIKVKNETVPGGIAVLGNGFGAFHGVFKPHQDSQLQIPVNVDRDTNVILGAFDRKGKKVKTLISGHRDAGSHTVSWDGRNEDGEKLSSGPYTLNLQIGDQKFNRKVVVIR